MNPVCPYCSVEIEGTDPNQVTCSTCGAAHHGECWEENAGCTVFGCASAPEEGPTVTVNESDLAAASSLPSAPATVATSNTTTLSLGGYNFAPLPPRAGIPRYPIDSKNRTTYILLGIFLGIFGAHNFYAGYKGRAIAQLCITLLTLFFGAIVSWIWAVVEVCIVDRDSRNIRMI
jgi:hypothetical protein